MEWVSGIGDDITGEDGDGDITLEIPNDLLIQSLSDSISTIVDTIYPLFLDNTNDLSFFFKIQLY